jgi:sugar/nucleoside kinase (ribokinase family)
VADGSAAKPEPKKKHTERQPLKPGQQMSSIQAQRTPEYLVVGHICADLLPDGRAVLGGTALYSALTAARLGLRVGVLTRGRFGETIDGYEIPSLEQFGDELSIIVQEADNPTFFVNVYNAGRRVQTLKKWAGEIDLRGLPPHWRNAKIIHLGPICQEIDAKQTGSLTPQFLGITPQGWLRQWPRPEGGKVTHHPLKLPGDLMGRVDAIVVSDEEIAWTRDAVEQVGARRLGVITKGEQGCRLVYGGEVADLPGYKVHTVDLTGAGDVFSAAFFIRASQRGVTAVDAAKFANALAALSLRAIASEAIPNEKDVVEFLKTAEEWPIRR